MGDDLVLGGMEESVTAQAVGIALREDGPLHVFEQAGDVRCIEARHPLPDESLGGHGNASFCGLAGRSDTARTDGRLQAAGDRHVRPITCGATPPSLKNGRTPASIEGRILCLFARLFRDRHRPDAPDPAWRRDLRTWPRRRRQMVPSLQSQKQLSEHAPPAVHALILSTTAALCMATIWAARCAPKQAAKHRSTFRPASRVQT